MGKFIKAVRKNHVLPPCRSQFQLKTWLEAATNDGVSDIEDLELVAAGVFFDSKLQKLWQSFSSLKLDFIGDNWHPVCGVVAGSSSGSLTGKHPQVL